MNKKVKTKYKIFIGLKDKDTLEEKIPLKDAIKSISNICKNSRIEFYIEGVYGGYINLNNKYILERSICLVLLNVYEKNIISISRTLKDIFNQEIIIVEKSILEEYII